MKTYPYLRAYMAGIFLPTLVLPILLTVFIVVRLVLRVPVPIERVIIFPMAIVPLLFGLWNMLWIGTHRRTGVSLGVQGAVLPILMVPVGACIAHCLGVLEFQAHGVVWFHQCEISYALNLTCFLAVLVIYYLAWKYIIGFFNRVLGIV